MPEKPLPFFKKHRFVSIAVVVIAVVLVWYGFFRAAPVSPYQTMIATPGELDQEVNVTGKVTAIDTVDLSFSVGGRIAQVAVDVGDVVSRGALLVSLENDDATAALAEAQANLASEQAKLDGLKAGTRPEDIAIARVNLSAAEQDLVNLYKDVPDTLESAYAEANDAVHVQLTTYFSNADSDFPSLAFYTNDTAAERDAETWRVTAENALNTWETELLGISVASKDETLDAALLFAMQHLSQVKRLLDAAFKVANGAMSLPSGVSSQSVLKGYATTGITEVNGALSDVNNAEQVIIAQKGKVAELSATLDLKLAGATKEDIGAQEARVAAAKAAVDASRATLSKTHLYAPFSGMVTRQDAKVGQVVGQTVGLSTSLISMMSSEGFHMEAYVPEADIAKVKPSDHADVTLDAYGEDVVFGATVTAIDPAETVIEGVSTYKVTLVFTETPELPRSGMTANIDIATASSSDVIAVPARAISEKDGVKSVQILHSDGSVEERTVTTGLVGSDGRVEISSGIEPGDEVITYTAEQ